MAPRLNQTALALLSLMDDEGLRARVHAELTREDARMRQERSASFEAAVTAALLRAFEARGADPVTVADIAKGFNRGTPDSFARPASAKWIGWFLRTRLRVPTTRSRGVFVVSQDERSKIVALAARYGVSPASSEAA